MNDFRTLIGDMVPPPPFLHRNAIMDGMFFDADMQVLQGYLDNSFNRIPGIRCEVQKAAVMLVTLYVEDVRPTAARYSARKGISEVDCGFWALVQCGRTGEQARLYWTPLCLFVDSVFALVIGRELYGFPKMLGSMNPTVATQGPDLRVEVRTDHFLRRGQSDVMVKNAPLFSVVRDPGLAHASHAVAADDLKLEVSDFLGSIDGVGTWNMAGSMLPDLPYLGMPMLFLRQLRSVDGRPEAAFSAVTAATMAPQGPMSVERVDDDDLRLVLHPSRNMPLRQLIGVTSGQPARLPFRVRLDFIAGPGEEI